MVAEMSIVSISSDVVWPEWLGASVRCQVYGVRGLYQSHEAITPGHYHLVTLPSSAFIHSHNTSQLQLQCKQIHDN